VPRKTRERNVQSARRETDLAEHTWLHSGRLLRALSKCPESWAIWVAVFPERLRLRASVAP